VVGVGILSAMLGNVDVSDCPIDGLLPELDGGDASQMGVFNNIVSLARKENLSIRQLYERLAGARGKLTVVGSVKDVSDLMEEWFVSEGADGFMLQPAWLPGTMTDFIALVLPELCRRKLFKEDYRGRTLRENLRLRRPGSRYTNAVPATEN
jgi:alkanesulfonate monooxygenase SsuD/methylene tetrahydromethanopterin reductase-like flavin-dependent oxidoreductase (luciferase family)